MRGFGKKSHDDYMNDVARDEQNKRDKASAERAESESRKAEAEERERSRAAASWMRGGMGT